MDEFLLALEKWRVCLPWSVVFVICWMLLNFTLIISWLWTLVNIRFYHCRCIVYWCVLWDIASILNHGLLGALRCTFSLQWDSMNYDLYSSYHKLYWVEEEKKKTLPIWSSFASGYFPPVEVNKLPWQPPWILNAV